MKNIKLSYEDVLDDWGDLYTELKPLRNFPKRQSMKKVIQRGMNNKVDFYNKDYHSRISDDKSPWYYAKNLLKVHGQSVEWALRRFKRRFPKFYDLEAFKSYFEESKGSLRNQYFRKRTNHVYNGIITHRQEVPRKIAYQTYDYKVIYWDPYGLVEVNKSEYRDYNSYVKGVFEPTDGYYYKKHVKENAITRGKLIRAYPFGIEMITKGERFEVNRNSKEERAKRFKAKVKNNKVYTFRHLSIGEKLHYDDVLKTNKKKSNKIKRNIKESKTFETSLNHSLHHSLDMLKLMSKEDLTDDLILRLNIDSLKKVK